MAARSRRAPRLLGMLALCVGLAGLARAAAAQEAAAAPEKIVVPLGATAMVDDPCPPRPPAPIVGLPEPGKPAVYAEPKVLAASQRYEAWRAANDWAALCRYRAENRSAAAGGRPRAVFMGDSITEFWKAYDPGFFTGGVLDRGVSGQTTPQMLVRFYPDVVRLKPRVVHIMAGTNDLAGNTGPTSEEAFKANIEAMVDLARANGIKVVLGSIPPAKRFSWRPELTPAAKVGELNAWLKGFAASRGAAYADYYAVLADADGGLKAEYTTDGVHPATAGYAAMKPVAERALAQAERR